MRRCVISEPYADARWAGRAQMHDGGDVRSRALDGTCADARRAGRAQARAERDFGSSRRGCWSPPPERPAVFSEPAASPSAGPLA